MPYHDARRRVDTGDWVSHGHACIDDQCGVTIVDCDRLQRMTGNEHQATTLKISAFLSSETSGDASAGEPLYAENCAMCHGDDGAGDGPAGAVFDMPDLTDAEHSDDYFFEVIAEGSGEMPGFGDAYKVEEIHDVIAYIRTFPQCT